MDIKTIGILIGCLSFLITLGTLIFNSGVLKGKVDRNTSDIKDLKDEKKKEGQAAVKVQLEYAKQLTKITEAQSQHNIIIARLSDEVKELKDTILNFYIKKSENS